MRVLRRVEEIHEYLEAVQSVLVAKEFVKQKELTDHVADEEQLGHQVHKEEIVALAATEQTKETKFAQEFSKSREWT